MTNATATKAPKELSNDPRAVQRRAARLAAKTLGEAAVKSEASVKAAAKPRKQPTAAPIKINAAQKRTIGQIFASVAAGFLPIASFVMAHYESKQNPYLWILVAAALAFSAPTLAAWAQKWCGHAVKAWGFTILLEGVMVASHTEWLSFAGLMILIAINAVNAYQLAAMKQVAAE